MRTIRDSTASVDPKSSRKAQHKRSGVPFEHACKILQYFSPLCKGNGKLVADFRKHL